MFDALPTPFWQVAVAVTAALLRDRDRRPGDRAHRHARPTACGSTPPSSASATRACAPRPPTSSTLALELLERADDPHADLASLYLDRWVARGRCPADDRLDQWRRDGTLFPPSESPVPYGVDALTVATGAQR